MCSTNRGFDTRAIKRQVDSIASAGSTSTANSGVDTAQTVVKFTDPNSQQWRQGWIYIINFVGPRQKSCPVDWTHHDQDGGWCDRDCSKNTDCKALKGYKCGGTRCFFAGD